MGIVLGWTLAGAALCGLVAFLLGFATEPNGEVAENTIFGGLLGAMVGLLVGLFVGFIRARRWLRAWEQRARLRLTIPHPLRPAGAGRPGPLRQIAPPRRPPLGDPRVADRPEVAGLR